MDEAKPIDLSALHLDSLTAAAGMSRRKQSNPRQIKRKFLSFTRRAAALPGGSEFIPDRRLRCRPDRTGPDRPDRHPRAACHGARVSLRALLFSGEDLQSRPADAAAAKLSPLRPSYWKKSSYFISS